jgi:hypothetical protein
MANDGSLAGTTPQFQFDLDSQQGFTHLLSSVRASEIPAVQKNEVRDLIFLYSNGGKDHSIRITLEQKVTAYGITPVAQRGNKQISIEHDFGTSRLSPDFPTVLQTSPVQPSPKTPVAPQALAAAVPNVPTPQTIPVAAPTQTAVPTPTPTIVPTTPVVPEVAPAASPVAQPVVAAPTPTPTPTPAPAPAPTPTPTPIPVQAAPPTQPVDQAQSLQRIREIKSLVNDKVGNPVNLVDINNEVGREYMSALLDAMKKLNTGSSAVSAMQRLESAYVLVEKTLAQRDVVKQPLVQTTPIAAVPVANVPSPVAPVAPVEEPVSMPVKPPVPVVPVVPPEKPVAPIVLEPVAPAPVAPSSAIPVAPIKSVVPEVLPAPAPAPAADPVPSVPSAVTPSKASNKGIELESPVSAWGPATDTLKNDSEKKTTFTSLADSKTPLRTPADLPEASSIETSSVEGDPLFTKEVDEGLQQLLADWSLFKKSGLFGTGPKGLEHPLFKKVSGLQIPLLLAGRFEGATQEIKQSITDYMNGWRYEQGIIYLQGENFEHYLRRVIRHIIDLQNSN